MTGSNGEDAVSLGLREDSPQLRLECGEGRSGIRIQAEATRGPELTLSDGDGLERARLAIDRGAPQLSMLDPGLKPRLYLGTEVSTPDNYGLRVTSDDGLSRAEVGTTKNSPAFILVSGGAGEWSALAMSRGGHPLLSFVDSTDIERIRVSLTPQQESEVALCSAEGQISVLARCPKSGFGLVNLSDGDSPTAVFLGKGSSGDVLAGIVDAAGCRRASLSLTPEDRAYASVQDSTASSAFLTNDGKGLCKLELNRKGKTRLLAGFDKTDTASFMSLDSEEIETWRSK
ncbi:MAG: hypothetical protein AAB074_15685 [Planctomycetota bacterium]